MHTQAEGTRDGLAGFAWLFDSLRQTAQRAAEAAVGVVREQANEVVDVYHAELRRAMAVYILCRAVLLFIWSAAVFAAVALESAWWASHRTAASLYAAAGFVVLAAASALLVRSLTRRNRSVGPIR